MPLRPYDQDQMFLLPPSLNEWVRRDHPARIFSELIDRIDTGTFKEVKDEGRPAYHPKMMLKVLLQGLRDLTFGHCVCLEQGTRKPWSAYLLK